MAESNLIVELSFLFALDVIEFAEVLEHQKKYVVARQLLKSGTSIGANVQEAQGAESKSDFVPKLKIAHKEAVETRYWLSLCQHSTSYPSSDKLLKGLESILKVLGKIISTSKA